MTFVNIIRWWKEISVAIIAIIGISYVAKIKHEKNKAVRKLEKVESDIAETRVRIIKKRAETKSDLREIEIKSEISTLNGLMAIEKETTFEIDKVVAKEEEYKVAVPEEKKRIRDRSKKVNVSI